MLWLLLIGRTYLKEIERSMVMAKHIAVAGKGGTGKTTIASLIVRHLVADNKGKVLAVDADPNATLFEALGIEITTTLSDIVEESKEKKRG